MKISNDSISPNTDTILRLPQLMLRTGLSRSTIYSRISRGSKYFDASFPKPVRLGAGSSIGWLASEVNIWLASRAQARVVA